MSKLTELLLEKLNAGDDVKIIDKTISTMNDINDRVNNGENPDDAVKKSLISAFASAPFDAYYGKTMLDVWEKLDPAVKSELEGCIFKDMVPCT